MDPEGTRFNVKLEKLRGDVCLSEGFGKLIQHYSLRVGYTIQFKYKGNGKFKIIIFDKNKYTYNYFSLQYFY